MGYEKIKNYVRQSALAIAQMPQENWQGPAFRQRTNPPKGFLETAHLSIALSLALDLCQDAFTAAEYDLCADALKTHAVPLCRAWLNNKPHFLNNWNAVLTCGVAMPAAVLDLKEELEFCSGYLHTERDCNMAIITSGRFCLPTRHSSGPVMPLFRLSGQENTLNTATLICSLTNRFPTGELTIVRAVSTSMTVRRFLRPIRTS